VNGALAKFAGMTLRGKTPESEKRRKEEIAKRK
jgi:hypothetical protein